MKTIDHPIPKTAHKLYNEPWNIETMDHPIWDEPRTKQKYMSEWGFDLRESTRTWYISQMQIEARKNKLWMGSSKMGFYCNYRYYCMDYLFARNLYKTLSLWPSHCFSLRQLSTCRTHYEELPLYPHTYPPLPATNGRNYNEIKCRGTL